MKAEDITENARYYRFGNEAHIVYDTHFSQPPNTIWNHHYVNSFCKKTFDHNESKGENVWGSKENILVEGVTLCEKCDEAFKKQQARGGPATDSFSKGMDLLREILKDRKNKI